MICIDIFPASHAYHYCIKIQEMLKHLLLLKTFLIVCKMRIQPEITVFVYLILIPILQLLTTTRTNAYLLNHDENDGIPFIHYLVKSYDLHSVFEMVSFSSVLKHHPLTPNTENSACKMYKSSLGIFVYSIIFNKQIDFPAKARRKQIASISSVT